MPRTQRPTRRSLANRRNAERSTGPRSDAGKARVARNAVVHRLSTPVDADPLARQSIDELAAALAGRDAPEDVRAAAWRIAEAQLDLQRIRKQRQALWQQQARVVMAAPASPMPPRAPFRDLTREELERLSRMAKAKVAALKETERQRRQALAEFVKAPEDAAGTTALALLARLDRYEQRALSRRRRAVKDFDGLGLALSPK